MNGKIESLHTDKKRRYRKKTNGNLEVKNTITETINSLLGLKSRMEMIEETASEFEDRQTEVL